MTYLDEEIAKLERQRRSQPQQEEFSTKNVGAETEQHTKEILSHNDVMTGLRAGGLTIESAEVTFEQFDIMQTGIQMFLPKDFVPSLESAEHFVYSSAEKELNLIMNWIRPTQNMSIQQFREVMQQQFRSMDMAMKWIEEGKVESSPLDTKYCLFTNSVANGEVFNYLAFIEINDHQLLFNMNGNVKRLPYWKPVIIGMISSLEVRIQ
ncbi:hypothetical protein OM416_07605 [Paenibacillus sp. LS1]|uniref:hypothetical protein n=1 Tax=Paenibacillus sp. LS1 TaxID=2992120 RepID=UPI00223136D9|nr:hypothetical protein [Paenibacillus sp. LS1]MCW3791440.1 hypothetical protein [Paenibacillus sp. LS1]